MKRIESDIIIDKIVEGIQERKGKEIVIVDMRNLKESPCEFFVISEGDSNTHVNAIAASIHDYVRDELNIKAYTIDGADNAEWIAMDYGHIIVHVFQHRIRQFYDIEQLWADAQQKRIDNIN